MFQLRQLTPDLLFHSGPAVFLTVYEESGTEGGLFLGVYCPSPERQREGGRQWRNLTAGEEGREGARLALSLCFSLRFLLISSTRAKSKPSSLPSSFHFSTLPLSLCIAPLHRLTALRSLHLFRFLFPPPPFAPAIVVVLLPLFLSHTCSFWQRPHIIFTLSLDSKGSECEALLQTFVLQTICSLCFLHSCSLADFSSSCSSLQGLFSSNNNPPRIGTARSVHHGKAFKKFLTGELLIV